MTCELNQYYPAPMYRSYAIFKKRGQVNVLVTSVDEYLIELEGRKKANEDHVRSLDKDMDKIYMRMKESQKQLDDCKKTCQNMENEKNALENDIFKLNRMNEKQKPPDMSALEEDRERNQERLENVQAEEAAILKKIEAEDDAIKEVAGILRVKEDEAESHQRKLEPLSERLERIDKRLGSRSDEKASNERKIEKFNKIKEDIRQKGSKSKRQLAEQQEIIQRDWNNIKVETDREPKVIHKLIKSLEDSIKIQANKNEPKKVVEAKYWELYEKCDDLQKYINYLLSLDEFLSKMRKKRKDGFNELRGGMSREVQIAFQKRLNERNFKGSLTFDHKNNTLELTVNPNGDEEDEENKRDMKTLSGGEKSFSTVSLVLALWECIQSPFRILDEFDVFMDMVNRRTALDMMTNFIKENRRYQYVFLTPLTMKSVDATHDDVQIVYLQKTDGS